MMKQLTELLERLAAELPPGTASVSVLHLPRGQGTIMELRPANPASAFLSIHLVEGAEILDFTFGPATWEFPYERRYQSGEKDIVAEIEEMSRAVIAGHCEVRRRLLGPLHASTLESTRTAFQKDQCFQFPRLERGAMRRTFAGRMVREYRHEAIVRCQGLA